MKFRLTVAAALAVLITAGVLTQGGVEAGGGGRNNAIKVSDFIEIDPDKLASNIFSNNQSVEYLGNKYYISENKIISINNYSQARKTAHTFSQKIFGGIYSVDKTALLYSGNEASGSLFSLNLVDGSTKTICLNQNIGLAVSNGNTAYLKCKNMIRYDIKNDNTLWSKETQYLYSIDFSSKNFLVGRDQNFYTYLYLKHNGKMFSAPGVPVILNGSQDLYLYVNPSIGLPANADDSDQYYFLLSKIYLDNKSEIQQTEDREFTIGPRKGCRPPPWVTGVTDYGNEFHMPRYPNYKFYDEGRLWFSQKDTCGEFLAGINFTDASIAYKSIFSEKK